MVNRIKIDDLISRLKTNFDLVSQSGDPNAALEVLNKLDKAETLRHERRSRALIDEIRAVEYITDGIFKKKYPSTFGVSSRNWER